MKAFMSRVAGWFTDARRAAIQAFVATVTSLLVVLGATSADQASALVDAIASVLLVVQGAVGLILLSDSDRFTWLNTTGRGLVYTAAGSVGFAGLIFQLWSEETSALIVSVSTVVASILVAAVQMMNVQTLTPTPAPSDLSVNVRADASHFVETLSKWANAATYRAERDPGLAPVGLAVGIYAPGQAIPPVEDVVALLAPDQVAVLDAFDRVEAFRGTSYDVILVTVPLTRDLIAEFGPATETSSYTGQRVRSIGVAE